MSRFGNLDATLIDNPYQDFLSSTRLPNWLHVAAERTQYDSGKKSITRAWMPDGSRPFRFAARISGGSAATLLCTLGQYHAKNRKREKTTMSLSTGLNSPTIALLSAMGKGKKQFYTVWNIVRTCACIVQHSAILVLRTVPESPWPSILQAGIDETHPKWIQVGLAPYLLGTVRVDPPPPASNQNVDDLVRGVHLPWHSSPCPVRRQRTTIEWMRQSPGTSSNHWPCWSSRPHLEKGFIESRPRDSPIKKSTKWKKTRPPDNQSALGVRQLVTLSCGWCVLFVPVCVLA